MAVSFKCPGCAANLVFDADKQKMICEYCGTEISLDDVADLEPILSNEAMQKENEQDAKLREPAQAVTQKPSEDSEAQVAATPQWDNESVQYVCNSCGATVITDQNTTATFCAFCGSPAIIAERLVQERTPDYVIPFQYGRDAAINGFFEWCKAGRFTPVQFVKKENVEKITGLYVPFWLFDTEADMNLSAEGKKVSSRTTGRSTYTTTSYYKVIRSRHIDWNNIPLDGATRIDDKLMEIVEPFEYEDLKPFDMKYLAGFFADKYDLSADKLMERLTKRLSSYVDRIFKESTKSYNSVSKVADTTRYQEPTFHYALMPVWILNYKYLGKTYTFAMNGQTGKIAGDPPVSRVKIIVLGLAVLPAAACICRLIGLLILGGFLA